MELSQEKGTKINSCMTTCPLNHYSSNFLALNYHFFNTNFQNKSNFTAFFIFSLVKQKQLKCRGAIGVFTPKFLVFKF